MDSKLFGWASSVAAAMVVLLSACNAKHGPSATTTGESGGQTQGGAGGKGGQGVSVGFGLPTCLVKSMTVGGVKRQGA